MKINIHAGHNASGKIACGAVSILNESDEARLVTKYIIKYLKQDGHTVYDCTVDNGANERDNLIKIANKCNAHNVDIDVSIHFNSGASDKKGNGYTTGSEVWVCSTAGIRGTSAHRICEKLNALGFKNRGVKTSQNLYILNHTNAPAILVEVCFVDDKDDANLYKKLTAKKIGKAIAEGIVGHKITEEKTYKVVSNSVNIRKGPSTSTEKVGKLNKGDSIKGIPEDSWLKTKQGYVRISSTLKTYLEEV